MKVMRIWGHWSTDYPKLYFEPPQLQNLDFDPSRNLALDFDAEPCGPDPQHRVLLTVRYSPQRILSHLYIIITLTFKNEWKNVMYFTIELVNNIHSLKTSFQDKNFAFKREQTPSLQIYLIQFLYSTVCTVQRQLIIWFLSLHKKRTIALPLAFAASRL